MHFTVRNYQSMPSNTTDWVKESTSERTGYDKYTETGTKKSIKACKTAFFKILAFEIFTLGIYYFFRSKKDIINIKNKTIIHYVKNGSLTNASSKTTKKAAKLLTKQNTSSLKGRASEEQRKQITRFFAPISPNQDEIIAWIQSNQFDVNSKLDDADTTLLHEASSSGLFKLASFLIEQGADVNAYENERSGSVGITALQKAQGDKLILLLLEKGADVNAKNSNGNPFLNSAIRRTRVKESSDASIWYPGKVPGEDNPRKILQEILQKKPEINAVDKQGKTALHVAAEVDDAEIVIWLLEADPDLSLKDDKGQTALEIARAKGNETVVKLLEAKSNNQEI